MTSWLLHLFPNCVVKEIFVNNETITVKAIQKTSTATCPQCKHHSSRVHSYYIRRPHDLPMSGYFVRLQLQVRRFRCLNENCQKKTFAEQWGDWLAPYAHHTKRVNETLYHVGQTTGGEGGSRLLRHLKLKSSGASVIRLIRNRAIIKSETPRVLGVDDWAYKRGQTYGTILIDLEKGEVIKLLPDRTSNTLANWLQHHPGVEIVTRDRSTEYAHGIDIGSPKAQQVADRWHLLLNMRQMVERYIREIYSRISQRPLTISENLAPAYVQRGTFIRTKQEFISSQKSRAQRLRLYEEIQQRRHNGESIVSIAHTLSLHRETVRTFYYSDKFPERNQTSPKVSILDEYVPYLEKRRAEGAEDARALWREIKNLGYSGGYSLVNKWFRIRRRRPSPFTTKEALTSSKWIAELFVEPKMPSAKKLAYLLCKQPDFLDAYEKAVVQHILEDNELAIFYSLIQKYHSMIRERDVDNFDFWLTSCMNCNVRRLQTFAEGLQKDYQAIKAALHLPWSNGPTEGHVNRLKLIKRQMFGRAKLDLLEQRILYASQ